MLKDLTNFLYYLVYYSIIYVFPFAFFFFLVITVGMRDRDSKLKFREIMQGFFRKWF